MWTLSVQFTLMTLIAVMSPVSLAKTDQFLYVGVFIPIGRIEFCLPVTIFPQSLALHSDNRRSSDVCSEQMFSLKEKNEL